MCVLSISSRYLLLKLIESAWVLAEYWFEFGEDGSETDIYYAKQNYSI